MFERPATARCSASLSRLAGDDDGVAEVTEAMREGFADARAAASDEDGVACRLHGRVVLRCARTKYRPCSPARRRHRKDSYAPKGECRGRKALADPGIEARRKQPVPEEIDPAIEVLVQDIIGKVADKWTMLILEALHEHGTLRFTQLGKAVGRTQ